MRSYHLQNHPVRGITSTVTANDVLFIMHPFSPYTDKNYEHIHAQSYLYTHYEVFVLSILKLAFIICAHAFVSVCFQEFGKDMSKAAYSLASHRSFRGRRYGDGHFRQA